MEANLNLSKTKKAYVLNFLQVATAFLVIWAFFECLFAGVFGSGVQNSEEHLAGLGYAVSIIVFVPFIIFCCSLIVIASVYKTIFATILVKFCKGQKRVVSKKLFVTSLVFKIVVVVLHAVNAFLSYLVIDAGGTPILAVVFALMFVGLGVFELIGIFAEKKSKREILAIAE